MMPPALRTFSVINYQIAAQDLDLKTVGDKVQIGNYGFAVLKGSNPELIPKCSTQASPTSRPTASMTKSWPITASRAEHFIPFANSNNRKLIL